MHTLSVSSIISGFLRLSVVFLVGISTAHAIPVTSTQDSAWDQSTGSAIIPASFAAVFSGKLLNQEVLGYAIRASSSASLVAGASNDLGFKKCADLGAGYKDSGSENSSVPLPEPASFALTGLGLVALSLAWKKRKAAG